MGRFQLSHLCFAAPSALALSARTGSSPLGLLEPATGGERMAWSHVAHMSLSRADLHVGGEGGHA
jgi:hypothetical protein